VSARRASRRDPDARAERIDDDLHEPYSADHPRAATTAQAAPTLRWSNSMDTERYAVRLSRAVLLSRRLTLSRSRDTPNHNTLIRLNGFWNRLSEPKLLLHSGNERFGSLDGPAGASDRHRPIAIIGQQAKLLNLAEVLSMLGRQMTRNNDLLAEHSAAWAASNMA
jgi:hypothetical protein